MLIRYVRSGGFTGMRTTGTMDTRSLPAVEAKKVEALVEAAGFFSLPQKNPKPTKGADFLTYTLTIEDEARSHSIEVSEPLVPESLRPLIHYLTTSKKG